MKNFKKLLNDEFEAASPELSEEVKNAPIITGKEADELSLAPLNVQLAPNLNGNVSAVGIVQQILKGNNDAV